jgi:hypothetical protein
VAAKEEPEGVVVDAGRAAHVERHESAHHVDSRANAMVV